MVARFDKKWFNPLYFILNFLIKDNSIRTIFVYGGKSSAKTFSILQILGKEAALHGKSSIALRKESTTIEKTLKKSLFSAIDKTHLYPAFKKMDRIARCSNGSEIVLTGIDDEEKAKGVEGYHYLMPDELNTFNEGEYDAFEMSLRGIPGQKIFPTWNPIDEMSWVKTNLIDKIQWEDTNHKLPCEHSYVKRSSCGWFVLIKTTYEDNFFITGSKGKSYTVNGVTTTVDEEYGYIDTAIIAKYNAMRVKNYNRYKIEVLGEWGKTTFGGEFLKQWRSEKHTGLHPYNPKLAVHLIFDENVNPYFPCGFFQVEDDNKSARMVHAIALRNPDNTTKAMGREIIRKLRSWGHEEAVYIGGDATSQKDDVKQEKGHDLFRLMMNELVDFKPRRAVLKVNPSVRVSADFLNEILENEYLGINYSVDKSCRLVIADYENTKEDKNGKVDKKTVIDPATKVSYQPYGHFVDITRYFFVQVFYNEYIQYQKGGVASPIKLGRNYSKNNY